MLSPCSLRNSRLEGATEHGRELAEFMVLESDGLPEFCRIPLCAVVQRHALRLLTPRLLANKYNRLDLLSVFGRQGPDVQVLRFRPDFLGPVLLARIRASK